jgi:hypothetical protein
MREAIGLARRREKRAVAPGPPLFLRWRSDPDRTYRYASWLADPPAWWCARCGSPYVVQVDGDMATFYQCLVCRAGVWHCRFDHYRCALCGRLAERVGALCPACGTPVAYPLRAPPPRRPAVPLWRNSEPPDPLYPDPGRVLREGDAGRA